MGNLSGEIGIGVSIAIVVLFAILVAVQWDRKGHSFVMGFLVSIFLSPIIAYVIGLFLPNRSPRSEKVVD